MAHETQNQNESRREDAKRPSTAPCSIAHDMNEGVWFKSSITGMFYRNHSAAGDIDCIIVDGVWYDKSTEQ